MLLQEGPSGGQCKTRCSALISAAQKPRASTWQWVPCCKHPYYKPADVSRVTCSTPLVYPDHCTPCRALLSYQAHHSNACDSENSDRIFVKGSPGHLNLHTDIMGPGPARCCGPGYNGTCVRVLCLSCR